MIYRLPCLIGKLSNVAEQKHILGREMRVVCWERSMTLRSLLKMMTHSPRKSIVDAFMDKTVSSLIFLLCRRFLHSGFWYFPFFSLWPKYLLLIFFSIHFSHSFTFFHTTFLFQCNHQSHSVLLFLFIFIFLIQQDQCTESGLRTVFSFYGLNWLSGYYPRHLMKFQNVGCLGVSIWGPCAPATVGVEDHPSSYTTG